MLKDISAKYDFDGEGGNLSGLPADVPVVDSIVISMLKGLKLSGKKKKKKR